MNKDPKDKWVESLDEAGLIDEIETVWLLPGEIVSGATIEVKATATLPRRPPTQPETSTLAPPKPSASEGPDEPDLEFDLIEPTPLGLRPKPVSVGKACIHDIDRELAGFMEDTADADDLPLRMKRQLTNGEYALALETAAKILATRPDDPAAIACTDASKEALLDYYLGNLSPLDRIPKPLIASADIFNRKLDPQSTFLFSRIDGQLTMEDIIDISGMSKFDTCRILNQLLEDHLIA